MLKRFACRGSTLLPKFSSKNTRKFCLNQRLSICGPLFFKSETIRFSSSSFPPPPSPPASNSSPSDSSQNKQSPRQSDNPYTPPLVRSTSNPNIVDGIDVGPSVRIPLRKRIKKWFGEWRETLINGIKIGGVFGFGSYEVLDHTNNLLDFLDLAQLGHQPLNFFFAGAINTLLIIALARITKYITQPKQHILYRSLIRHLVKGGDERIKAQLGSKIFFYKNSFRACGIIPGGFRFKLDNRFDYGKENKNKFNIITMSGDPFANNNPNNSNSNSSGSGAGPASASASGSSSGSPIKSFSDSGFSTKYYYSGWEKYWRPCHLYVVLCVTGDKGSALVTAQILRKRNGESHIFYLALDPIETTSSNGLNSSNRILIRDGDELGKTELPPLETYLKK